MYIVIKRVTDRLRLGKRARSLSSLSVSVIVTRWVSLILDNQQSGTTSGVHAMSSGIRSYALPRISVEGGNFLERSVCRTV